MIEKDRTSLPRLQQLPQLTNRSELNGEQGSNREDPMRCQIHAKNDYEAVYCWLNEFKHKANTFRTYQKEAERLLLWAIFQCGKPLSSLTRDDLEQYLEFLDDPTPKEIWCAKDQGRGRKRGDPSWRPFIKGLSITAKQTAISSIDSLFNYLVDARYLQFNPLVLMRKKRLKLNNRALVVQERILEVDEWHAFLDTINELSEKDEKEKEKKERVKFLVKILYFLGLRIEELAIHTWSSFRKTDNVWWFYVTGKGNKEAKIPVNDELLRAVIVYRMFLKKAPLPEAHETTALIPKLKKADAITTRYINKILKKIALKTAEKFQHKPDKANRIKKISAHWLRHLSASMQDRLGIKEKHIQENHRHENPNTTKQYIHAFDEERYADMQKLKLRIDE